MPETYKQALRQWQREYLMELLVSCRGNMSAAGKMSGKNRTDLYKLINRVAPELLIDPERVRQKRERAIELGRKVAALPHKERRPGNAEWQALGY